MEITTYSFAGMLVVLSLVLYGRATKLKSQIFERELKFERELEDCRLTTAVQKQNIVILERERLAVSSELEKSRIEIRELGEHIASQKPLLTLLSNERDTAIAEASDLKAQILQITERAEELRTKASELEVVNQLLKQSNENQPEVIKRLIADASITLTKTTAELLDSRVKEFDEHALENMGNVLNPLKENIEAFENLVKQTAAEETKEKIKLKVVIEQLCKGTDKMNVTTAALERTFRGNSKYQGNYGELVLDKVLESAGLEEGREYEKQASLKTENGTNAYPDVIVKFTDNRKVVIDSKASLSTWEAYNRTSDKDEQSEIAKAHVKAVMKHVDGLAERDYSNIIGASSPDFVFMFIPIEPAYLLALEHEPELHTKAVAKRVMIVGPSTLILALKMVGDSWVKERQNRNAQKIAEEAGKLYDKFTGLFNDLQDIEKTFDKGGVQIKDAISKLKFGPGSVIRKMDELVRLGAAPQKSRRIKPELVEEAAASDEDSDAPLAPTISKTVLTLASPPPPETTVQM